MQLRFGSKDFTAMFTLKISLSYIIIFFWFILPAIYIPLYSVELLCHFESINFKNYKRSSHYI